VPTSGSAIPARERFADTKPKKTPKAKGKKKRKKAVFAKESAACRAKRDTRLRKQAKARSIKEMRHGVSTATTGARSGGGDTRDWRWPGLHHRFDNVGQRARLSGRHCSPLAGMAMSSKRLTDLYKLMDSAYDAEAIHQASKGRNHRPIISPHPRRKSRTKLLLLVKPAPKLCPADQQ
jgi:hypothetical protein